MKISIITPSHNTAHLKELEETILSQTHTDWEWVIMLNQGAKYKMSGERGVLSGEIKVIECPFVNDSVGFLKRLACMNATGEVIAEVDHDDLLVKDCLAKVAKAFEDPEVGFVFSQNAKLSKNFRPYMPEYGWTHKKYNWKGKSLYAMDNQPVYPGRLGHIWFAPDHIRAWRKDVYESIGGHDDSLQVCDDLDLMHRLYMVTKFREIPKVLYIYRISGDNTFINKNQLIQEKDRELYDKNIHALAERFADLHNLAKIDMSSNETDFQPGVSYPDNSVGVIVANDSLQYQADPRRFMTEAHRVLAPGGMLLSKTPSTDGRGAFMDPTHVSFWNESSFWYYTRENYARKIRGRRLFRECKLATAYPDEYCKENKIAYVTAHLEKIL
jgi:glycosyltransferase involved in cell wall biosynthesis